jgi:GNAT superfamily N-acetyltransferase
MSKRQTRKEKMKEETAQMNERVRKVSVADTNEDNLSDIPMFKVFKGKEFEATNTYYKQLPAELNGWVYDLTFRNMYDLYVKTWGWDEKKKKKELYDERARYCVMRVGERPVGFAHIRFEIERNLFRVFIFEFQVEKEFQGKGVGRFLLQSVEFIGLKRGAECVMLTVFRINTGALAFYRKFRYILSDLSPGSSDPGNPEYDYELLVKSLVKK